MRKEMEKIDIPSANEKAFHNFFMSFKKGI